MVSVPVIPKRLCSHRSNHNDSRSGRHRGRVRGQSRTTWSSFRALTSTTARHREAGHHDWRRWLPTRHDRRPPPPRSACRRGADRVRRHNRLAHLHRPWTVRRHDHDRRAFSHRQPRIYRARRASGRRCRHWCQRRDLGQCHHWRLGIGPTNRSEPGATDRRPCARRHRGYGGI